MRAGGDTAGRDSALTDAAEILAEQRDLARTPDEWVEVLTRAERWDSEHEREAARAIVVGLVEDPEPGA